MCISQQARTKATKTITIYSREALSPSSSARDWQAPRRRWPAQDKNIPAVASQTRRSSRVRLCRKRRMGRGLPRTCIRNYRLPQPAATGIRPSGRGLECRSTTVPLSRKTTPRRGSMSCIWTLKSAIKCSNCLTSSKPEKYT